MSLSVSELRVRAAAVELIEAIKGLAEIAGALTEDERRRVGESLEAEMGEAEKYFAVVFPGWEAA